MSKQTSQSHTIELFAEGEEVMRKIVKISTAVTCVFPFLWPLIWVFALCNDGTVWTRGNSKWARMPPIPQDGAA